MVIFFLSVPLKKMYGHFIITHKVKRILVPVVSKFKVMIGFVLHAGLSYIW